MALGETIWEGSAGSGTLTVNGNGHAIRGDGTYRFFALWGAPTITFNNITFTGAVGDDRESGGAFNPYSGAGTYTFNDCAFHNNEVLKIVQGTGGNGGAISAGSATTITINRCAFYNNRAVVGGAIFTSGVITISNSSFYNNRSTVEGGAVRIAHTGNRVSNFRHVTMTNNRAGTGHSALQFTGSATNSHLVNSILWGNSPRDCQVDTTQIVDFPRLTTNSGSFTGASNCDFEQRNQGIKEDPQLAGPFGGYYIPRAGSPAINRVTCLASTIAGYNEDQRGQPRPRAGESNSECDAGAIEHPGYVPPPPPPSSDDGGGSGDGGSGGDDDEDDEASAYKAPPPSTCLTLDGIAAYNLSESTQCQRVDAVGIANPAIQEGDFVDAVDVWSWVMPDTRVCFEASGSAFKFIDTATMPRTVQDLAACSWNGMTCGAIDGIGMLVLLPGEAPSACAAPVAPATPIPARSLSGCMVRTNYALNMRDAPAGAKIGGVPYDVTLTALARTVGWIKVDYHGAQGWIAAMYVEPIGTCG